MNPWGLQFLNDMRIILKLDEIKRTASIDVSYELSPLTRINWGLEVSSLKDKINEDVRENERMITGLLENLAGRQWHYTEF
jgi:hypothetical protein